MTSCDVDHAFLLHISVHYWKVYTANSSYRRRLSRWLCVKARWIIFSYSPKLNSSPQKASSKMLQTASGIHWDSVKLSPMREMFWKKNQNQTKKKGEEYNLQSAERTFSVPPSWAGQRWPSHRRTPRFHAGRERERWGGRTAHQSKFSHTRLHNTYSAERQIRRFAFLCLLEMMAWQFSDPL